MNFTSQQPSYENNKHIFLKLYSQGRWSQIWKKNWGSGGVNSSLLPLTFPQRNKIHNIFPRQNSYEV